MLDDKTAFTLADEIVRLQMRTEKLERVTFLLLELNRADILRSPRLDEQDKQILADFYDEMRGRSW